ncbi:hypothetical protein CDD81_3984 [Ophiocordyceps australis]|uniref:MACPF domain-containing protein n=1 Tax=Ophiocordyceps australis TaxID=1399860 RepID=A0A2C5YBU2_9HYPO|nr:hypothetical protein CDD81_3984 [Ophiocordyceps australis]
MTFKFTPPQPDVAGLNLRTYFVRPDPKAVLLAVKSLKSAAQNTSSPMANDDKAGAGQSTTVRDEAGDTVLAARSTIPCTRGFTSQYHLVEDYLSYLKILGISAGATVSGWGQSASVSGDYLNQAKFEKSTLTYVATMEVQEQLDVDQEFWFNKTMYSPETFHMAFGNRWIHGFQTGGKIIVRISIKSKGKANANEIKAHAEASLHFWGVGTSISGRVKKSMEELDKHADVEVSMHYQGEMGNHMQESPPENTHASSVEEILGQAKWWATKFVENSCKHNYKYRAILDEYENVPNFPWDQPLKDYSNAHEVAYLVLKERVKVSELAQVLQTGGVPTAFAISRIENNIHES